MHLLTFAGCDKVGSATTVTVASVDVDEPQTPLVTIALYIVVAVNAGVE